MIVPLPSAEEKVEAALNKAVACMVCAVRRRKVVLLDCGDLVYCHTCARNLSQAFGELKCVKCGVTAHGFELV